MPTFHLRSLIRSQNAQLMEAVDGGITRSKRAYGANAIVTNCAVFPIRTARRELTPITRLSCANNLILRRTASEPPGETPPNRHQRATKAGHDFPTVRDNAETITSLPICHTNSFPVATKTTFELSQKDIQVVTKTTFELRSQIINTNHSLVMSRRPSGRTAPGHQAAPRRRSLWAPTV
jgi:hypothetical protein